MSIFSSINPYKIIGEQHAAGLDFIEPALTTPLITNLSDVSELVYEYVQSIYFPSPDAFIGGEIFSILPNAYNDYVNIRLNGYTSQQNYFISVMLNGIFEVPIDSISEFFDEVATNVTESGMTLQEQAPLFMAIAVAQADSAYWIDKIGAPGNWSTFFSPNAYVNYANVPYWVAAAIHGTLTGANKAVSYGMIDPPRIVGVDMVSALIASIGLVTAKVAFKPIPRISLKMASVFGSGSNGIATNSQPLPNGINDVCLTRYAACYHNCNTNTDGWYSFATCVRDCVYDYARCKIKGSGSQIVINPNPPISPWFNGTGWNMPNQDLISLKR